MSKLGRAFYKSASKSVDYWAQAAMRFFVRDLGQRMHDQEISRADLARKIDSSTAYVTKVMRGDVNFTLETMTKLALAVNGKLSVRIVPDTVAMTSARSEASWRIELPRMNVAQESCILKIAPDQMSANSEFDTEMRFTWRAA